MAHTDFRPCPAQAWFHGRGKALLGLGMLAPAALLAACGTTRQPSGSAAQELRVLFEGSEVAWLDIPATEETDVPPLVYIHGWAGDGTVWGAQLEALRGTARQIVLDLPGHGRSEAPEVDYSIPFLTESVLAVLDEARIQRAILVAHSNGVIVARQLLRQAEDRVAGLVLVDGPMELLMGDGKEVRQLIEQLESPRGPDMAAALIRDMLPRSMPPELRRRFMQRAGSTAPHVLASTLEATLDPAVWAKDQIEAPTLMVNAAQPVWTKDYGARVRALIPDLDYRLLPGTAHFVMLDPPDRFNDMLLEFCQRWSRLDLPGDG